MLQDTVSAKRINICNNNGKVKCTYSKDDDIGIRDESGNIILQTIEYYLCTALKVNNS